MSTIVETLTSLTTDFKADYLANVTAWASKRYDETVAFGSFDVQDWCKYFGIECKVVEGERLDRKTNTIVPTVNHCFPNGFHTSAASKEKAKRTDAAYAASNIGKEGFIAREVKAAEIHYSNSIVKLADAIAKKGMGDDLTITSARVGVNFEATITDGRKTVRAFTIVAEGQIQRPHYRYLVK